VTNPSEDEIRALVERVVAEVGPALGAAAPPAVAAGGAEPPAARAATGAGVEAVGGASAGGSSATGASRRIALGADHGGYALKTKLVDHLRRAGWEIEDCGTHATEACDYPDFAHAVGSAVASGRCRAGVVVDGAGIGSAMVANKVPGVRASLCYDLSSARNAREHNHANVLTLGAGLIGEALAVQIVDTWLATPWGGDRHARRVEKIMQVEARYLAPTAGGVRP
jgi:ribose 5-phosphate isomerase B